MNQGLLSLVVCSKKLGWPHIIQHITSLFKDFDYFAILVNTLK
jgi:hypothetical protein